MSPFCGLLSFVILLQNFRKSKDSGVPRAVWLLLSLGCLSWALADIYWAAYDIATGLDPSELIPVVYLYTLTNLFLAAGIILFVTRQFIRWHGAKLILDAVVFALASMLLFWVLFLNRSADALGILMQDGISSALCIFSDFFIYLLVVIWYLSIRSGRVPVFLFLMMGGAFLFSTVDLFYYNAYFYGDYIPNSIVDSFYIGSLMLIAAAALMQLHTKEDDALPADSLYSNTGRRAKEIAILLCPVLIMVIKGFFLWELLFYFVLFIIYQALGTYIQASIFKEELLQREKKMNTQLSEIVAERTQRLVQANSELYKLSSMDTLTNLYNRRYFFNKLEEHIRALLPEECIVLFFLDLDRFKIINDTYGHGMGDKVLAEIARRLEAFAKENVIIARMGGDEFMISCFGNYDNEFAEEIAREIIKQCGGEIQIGHYVFEPALCIGIASCAQNAMDAETLMKNADIALYHAKSMGINQYAFYDRIAGETYRQKNKIELMLNRADPVSEFSIEYQPQFEVKTNRLVGAESMVRCNCPARESFSTAELIHLSEEMGRISQVGNWLLSSAAEQAIRWNSGGGSSLKIGVNISQRQICSAGLIEELRRLKQKSSFDPGWLDIEITESIAVEGDHRMPQMFQLFKSIGMTMSVADFGTRYSSVNSLSQFHFDRIKISDRLIGRIAEDEDARNIVKAIIVLGKTTGITMIADGVETEQQLQILQELGCDQAQGDFLGKPVPPEEFEALYLKK